MRFFIHSNRSNSGFGACAVGVDWLDVLWLILISDGNVVGLSVLAVGVLILIVG